MLATQLGEQSPKPFMILHGCPSSLQGGGDEGTAMPMARGRMVAMTTINCLACMFELESSRLRIKVGFRNCNLRLGIFSIEGRGAILCLRGKELGYVQEI